MEIPDITKTKALILSHKSSIHSGLNNLLKKLDEKMIDELLGFEKFEEIDTIYHQMYDVFLNSIYYKKSNIVEIAQLIFTERQYLVSGISNGNIKSILIFLSINCYLKIGIEDLLEKKDYPESKIQPLSENITKLLLNVNIETKALPEAPFYEKELMQASIKGFASNNINATYNLIESIERSGNGFHFNFLLENLISFFYEINFSNFVMVLSTINNPQTLVFYLHSFEKESLCKLSNEKNLTNKWLNFEIIRQIIQKCTNKEINDIDCTAINKSLLKIEETDFDFFKQTVQFFNPNILFNTSLGELASSFSNEKIIQTINCFGIDEYSSKVDARNKFLESFTSKCSEHQQEVLLTNIFQKWNSFINNLLISENYYQSGLLITDYADFVLQYYTLLVPDKDLLCELELIMGKIKHIDSEWSISESQHLTKFHLYHSRLYILSYAYRNKKMKDAKILHIFTDLQQNNIQYHRYFKDEKFNHFEIMNKNFSGNNQSLN